MKTKIGLLGGTFDPPHTAHLIIAQEALTALRLDEVWFIPVHTPPHKTREKMADPYERFDMTNKAIKGNKCFQASAIELERKGPSYTVETVKTLKEMTEDTEFYFIIGGDMAEQLENWKRIEELKRMVTFVVAQRPGYETPQNENASIMHIKVPQMEISSTLIRERRYQGKSIRYYVPEEVWEYIEERNLYG
ncbi:nicotinate-nucleotide adenylyltransferase [Alteribacillus sp. YIM 98480]|uniref:nicotinate-nucleotide adenylyltransferase n=1 Tax=Alteribacillus sp. YIM 98480 TaxID=2606599 RepID=UPI00131E1C4E|nr:nicotinate-nucleotide adenylyltransferase [Alteribacillus sp. YIM 98480]